MHYTRRIDISSLPFFSILLSLFFSLFYLLFSRSFQSLLSSFFLSPSPLSLSPFPLPDVRLVLSFVVALYAASSSLGGAWRRIEPVEAGRSRRQSIDREWARGVQSQSEIRGIERRTITIVSIIDIVPIVAAFAHIVYVVHAVRVYISRHRLRASSRRRRRSLHQFARRSAAARVAAGARHQTRRVHTARRRVARDQGHVRTTQVGRSGR